VRPQNRSYETDIDVLALFRSTPQEGVDPINAAIALLDQAGWSVSDGRMDGSAGGRG
jgi:hypothetical protein